MNVRLPQSGTVVSLHVHSAKPGEPLTAARSLTLVEGKGIAENPRYFGRVSRRTGKPSRRHVSLIAREQIAGHAALLRLPGFPPGAVRSNIETAGVDLCALVGHEVQVGEAILRFYEARTPCAKMDVLCKGLRALMENGKQGVMAEVIHGGIVRVGDSIKPR